MSINQVLHKIQKNLSVPKDRVNAFGKYKYRSAEDIVDAVKALLPEGYALLLSDEMVLLGDRYYVKASAVLFGEGEEKEQIRSFGYARETQEKKGFDESQITGAASSYARKYALNGLFAIDDGNDADATNKGVQPENPLKKAEEFVKKYLTELEGCKVEELVELTQKNNAALTKIHNAYPELSKKINEAMARKRRSA